jgi:predicted nucleic acid-binding protein
MHASLARSESPKLILDSWPVMEWLKGRKPVTDAFRLLLERARSGRVTLILSDINLGEIYYNSWKEWGEARAEAVLDLLRAHPIQVVHPTEAPVLAAARVKARYAISYADAFAVVLAVEFGGAVLTGDRDFLPLATDGVLNVDWIGA